VAAGGSSSSSSAGSVGGSRSARARQAQAFVDTYKAAFERDFRLGGAEGSGGNAPPPLSLQEVRAFGLW
jgi:hypothetical protein